MINCVGEYYVTVLDKPAQPCLRQLILYERIATDNAYSYNIYIHSKNYPFTVSPCMSLCIGQWSAFLKNILQTLCSHS